MGFVTYKVSGEETEARVPLRVYWGAENRNVCHRIELKRTNCRRSTILLWFVFDVKPLLLNLNFNIDSYHSFGRNIRNPKRQRQIILR